MGFGHAHGGETSTAVTCSICLDEVTDDGVRSWAELQCGHKFHLDCIGSAFNVKGAMQCPNCRKIEKGQWLYANGSRPSTEFNMDSWAHDEDFYDLTFSEMSFGTHWCPVSSLTGLPTSFDEGEFQSSAYHDLLRHHPLFAEHAPVSSMPQPSPYVAYVAPVHPSSPASNGNMSDGSSFNNHRNPSAATHYHIWDRTPIYPGVQRTSQNDYNNPRSIMRHPLIVGRSPSDIPSSALPRFPGPIARPCPPSYIQQAAMPHISSNQRNHFYLLPFQEGEREPFQVNVMDGGGFRLYRQRMASQSWL